MNTASKSLPPVQQILKQWDTGKRLRREQILKAVIANGHVRTKEEIENLFEGAASLLLSRFVAWLHLSYAKKQSIALLLEAIAVLIRPMGRYSCSDAGNDGTSHMCKLFTRSNSLRLELIEAGGVGTLTDLLCLDAAPTHACTAAIHLLGNILKGGKEYCSILLDLDVFDAIIHALELQNDQAFHEAACELLMALHQDPAAALELYQHLLTLASMTASSRFLISIGNLLNRLVKEGIPADLATIHAGLQLLGSSEISVALEGERLLLQAAEQPKLKQAVQSSLMTALRSAKETAKRHEEANVLQCLAALRTSASPSSEMEGKQLQELLNLLVPCMGQADDISLQVAAQACLHAVANEQVWARLEKHLGDRLTTRLKVWHGLVFVGWPILHALMQEVPNALGLSQAVVLSELERQLLIRLTCGPLQNANVDGEASGVDKRSNLLG
eukprot:TRINITY_DN10681_c0_g1_i6.p1 TRINITY_DN10681_c0_g1~~TRINITY_DN10681_c0_g1_i6.p1  ORF type:complete len:444 (+),score=71.32 TRINITY_DN10681_c0_g1_i6:60-1391(+)